MLSLRFYLYCLNYDVFTVILALKKQRASELADMFQRVARCTTRGAGANNLVKKTNAMKGYFFRAGQCAVLSSFRI